MTGGLGLSETEVSQSCRDMERHSVRCCCDRTEASKTVVAKVAFGSIALISAMSGAGLLIPKSGVKAGIRAFAFVPEGNLPPRPSVAIPRPSLVARLHRRAP